MSWLLVPIGQLCRPVTVWDPAQEAPDKQICYIDIASIDREWKTICGESRFDGCAAPSRARQIVEAGDVLVSTVRPNLNAVARVPPHLHGSTASTGFAVLRPRSETLDSAYLFFWARSPQFVALMTSRATGASYPAVTDAIVKSSLLPLPPLPAQKRIAAILDAADALRRKRREAIDRLDALPQSVFLDIFGDPVTNPRGWKTSRLIDLVDPNRGIPYGIVQGREHDPSGDYVVRIADILRGEIDTTFMLKASKSVTSQYKRTQLQGGELVISIRGTVGRCALIPPELKGGNITRELALVPLKRTVSSVFILHLLRVTTVQRRLVQDVKGLAQRGINLADLRELRVITPSETLVTRFEGVVAATTRLPIATAQSKLDDLFSSLQQRAFRADLSGTPESAPAERQPCLTLPF